jgi:hypothetical protein
MRRFEIERAVQRAPMTAPSKAIMMALCTRISGRTDAIEPQHSPSLRTLAQMTGLSKSTVCEHLGLLEWAGWVVRTRRPQSEAGRLHLTTVYRLRVPDWFSADPCPAPGPGDVRQPDNPGPSSGHGPVRQPGRPGPPAAHKQSETGKGDIVITGDDDLREIATAELAALGRTVSPAQAAEIVRLVLDGRAPKSPASYLRAAIRRDPQRFAPRGNHPPPFADLARLQAEAIAKTKGKE